MINRSAMRVPVITADQAWTIVEVAASGAIRDRPERSLDRRHPGIARYLRALPGIHGDRPFSFLWLEGSAVARSSDSVVRVDVVPAASERVSVQLHMVESEAVAGLSRRELEVLSLVACGLSNAEIAGRLHVARRTVATHLEHILAKLNVSTRVGATALAHEWELLALPLPDGDLTRLPPLPVVRLEATVRGDTGRADDHRMTLTRVLRKGRRRPLTIGAVYPANPDFASDGHQMATGAQLAISQVNDGGGVRGLPLQRVVVHADMSDPSDVRRAVTELVEADVDAVTLGYAFARSAESIAFQLDPVAATGCPLLHHSTSVSAAKLVADDPSAFGSIFQVCGPETAYGLGFVRTLDSLRASGTWRPSSRQILILDTTDPDLRFFTSAAADAAAQSGWQPTVLGVDALVPEWEEAVRIARAIDPAAVMIGCVSPPQVANIVSRLREQTDALLYALYAPSVPAFLGEARDAAEGLLWATVTGRSPDRFGTTFATAYRLRFGVEAGMSSAAIHFDMVRLLTTVWAQCDSPYSRAEVAKGLREVVYRGVNGAYHLGTRTQTNGIYPDTVADASIAQAHLVYQIQNGKHSIVAPHQYATSGFAAPAVRS